ncbi:MDR family MFS transporter [Promethearchaeum syntrophicum]|uniref:MDR family MFS transporter n=1 Tax=Promethearchaeum syntrophicum TaxID=2594042 RepID=A0AC61ZU49_9ARCH
MTPKFKNLKNEFPRSFKVLTLANFIDRMGTFLLFPFFSIYLVERFEAEFIEVGYLFTLMSLGGLFGNMIGGAITDKIGRKKIIIFGLTISGIGSIFMGLVTSLDLFYILSVILGFLGDVGGPARQAMVPDLLPKEQHSQGYAILRIAVNISATVGPILGGFIAENSYMALFILDAISSLITAVIVLFWIPETKPELSPEIEKLSFLETLKGYKDVLRDLTFMLFIGISTILILVYMQMYGTLSVFLIAERDFSKMMIGWLMSINAAIVVIFQFWLTKLISRISLLRVMALGALFYGVGFGMFGFVTKLWLIFLAMIIVTIGEMIALPTSQSVAAKFAPDDKRGRYMAIFGFSWAIPNLYGFILAGAIMDKYNPNWVWYGAAILSSITIVGYLLLHQKNKQRFSDNRNLEINEENVSPQKNL